MKFFPSQTSRLPVAAIPFLLLPLFAAAATGNLQVTVTTDGTRPLAGAVVELLSRDGETRRATTDAGGRVVISSLETGLYRVSASHDGYLGAVEPSIRVVRNKTVPINFVVRERQPGTVEEIVVVADRIKRDPFGVSSVYLDRERLRTAAGSGADVFRALDGLPGLVTTGEFSSFTVRGRGPRDNLIFVDGFPFDKVVHFDADVGEQTEIEGGGRFSIFAPNLIGGAEFSPGGWSAAYGGRAGSLLRLDVAQGNPSPSASLRIDLAGLELVYDGPSGFRDDTSIIVTARHFDFGMLFDTIGEEDIGEPVMSDLIVKTHTQIDSSNELEFLLLYTPETEDRDVSHVLASENLEDRELLEIEQDSALVGITWSWLFGTDGRWENRFYFRDSDKTSSEGEAFPDSEPMLLPIDQVPIRENIFTLEEKETEIGWRSDLTTSNRWGLFSAGLRLADLDLDFATTLDGDWIRYEYDGRSDFRPDPSQRYIVLTPEFTNSSFSRNEIQYSVYAEQMIERGAFGVRAGLRYEYDGFSDESYLSPRFALNYQYSPLTRFSATAGRFYQSPRYLDRAADLANFDLENERIDHVSLGVEHSLGSQWNLLVEIYYQELSDLVTDGDRVTGRASNNGEGTSYGLDVVVNRQFDNGWSANAVYAYNNATLNDNDGEGEYDADYNYEHLISIASRWEINDRWQVSFRWKYATGRPRDDFVVYEDVLADIGGPLRFSQEYTARNTLRWDDFHTLNARVDYRRPLGPVDFIAFLDVLNVYGAATTDEREFNAATGSVVEDDGETLPLIGIRFEKTW
ncbi:MAG: TonB-dependent receptor [Xanthomonadales bacterium]|nr:TonB-dependent receptor [Xanthomonadales bacterium]